MSSNGVDFLKWIYIVYINPWFYVFVKM